MPVAKPAKPAEPPPRPPTRELLQQADQLLALARGGRRPSAPADQTEDDKEYLVQRQAEQRRERSFTGTWLPDVLLNAGPVVADLHEVLEPSVEPYRRMLGSVEQAARGMSDEYWAQFAQMACECVHLRDMDILGDLFSAAEESWTTMLRGAANMTFLHLGTAPMSDEMGEFWRNLKRWTGFSVAPGEPTNIGDLDGIVQVLPIDAQGDMAAAFDDFANFRAHKASDGDDAPSEQRFKLVIVDFVQEPLPKQAATPAAAAKARAPRTAQRRGALLPAVGGRPDVARNCSSIGQGFGLIGATRGVPEGLRLRTLKSMISAGLHKLEAKGNMVIWWGGLPGHPVLLFLTRYLRDAFEKVHVLSLPGTESFDVCVLCCGFNREVLRDRPGEPRVPIGSFLRSAFRGDSLDDAMLWSLTPKEAVEEALGVGNTQRTKGYDELWTLFAKKYKELGLTVSGGLSGAPVKRPARGKPKEPKKAAPRPSLLADAADGGPAGPDGGPSGTAAASKGGVRPAASPTDVAARSRATLAGGVGGDEGGDEDAVEAPPRTDGLDAMPLFELRALCASRGLDSEGDRKKLTMRLQVSGWGSGRAESGVSVRKAYSRTASSPSFSSAKACMRTWRWQDSVDSFSGDTVECFRDQPWLACSLGASPGGHSTAGPNPMELASQFPVIRQALASVQAEQQRAKENPELWPAAVSRDRAELQRRTRRRPPLDADLSTLRSVATGLSFRESAGTLLTKTR